MIGRIAFAAVALAVAIPAGAQTPLAPTATQQPDATDPATLAEARTVVAKLMPPGFYKTVMKASMAPVIDSMSDSMEKVPLQQIARASGMDPDAAARLSHVDMARAMTIYDPDWKERQRLTMQAMLSAMGDFFTTQEPELRDAMAHAYAHRFTLDDLIALNRFFATPPGAKFAQGYMTIMTDPAMVAATKAMMPRIMQHMPEFVAAAQKATASLPRPRKIDDLTPAERQALSDALGIAPDHPHAAKSN